MGITEGVADKQRRKQELVDFYYQVSDCQNCGLAKGRTNVVFGSGDPDAGLMFVGEAPGFNEDQQAKPFVGRAGKLLDQLLAEIELERKQVFIANVLKCRPPDNRDPQPTEVEACKNHLFKQIELTEPKVICTLGNFATKLLTGKQEGITRVHGVPQIHELAGRTLFIYPIFHPAAALRNPNMVDTLREDMQRLPALLNEAPSTDKADTAEEAESDQPAGVEQIGLF